MRMGVSQLMTCHAIYLLPGWQQSKGASLEYLVAQQLGLVIYEHATQDDVLQEQLQTLVTQSRLAKHGQHTTHTAHTPHTRDSAEEICA